jgi:predicted ArsR family transcriptional regulator
VTYNDSANVGNDLSGEHDEAIRLQAKALCDRTRYNIYNTICSSTEPLTVAELTAAFKLNHNAIRQHLAVLVNADLVREELELKRTNPGRPRLFYSAAEREKLAFRRDGYGDDHGDNRYNHIALLLAKAINNNIAPRELGRLAAANADNFPTPSTAKPTHLQDAESDAESKVGQEGDQAAQSASNQSTSGYIEAIDGIMQAMEKEGFHTKIVKRGKQVELVIDSCPFSDIVDAAPRVMCDLHLGMAEGIAATTGNIRVVDLKNRRTHNDSCRLVLQQSNG